MQGTVKVWDPLVRICHWILVLSVFLAWATQEGWGAWHEWIGLTALAVVAIRLPWGFLGTATARFAQFVRAPSETLDYARRVIAGNEERHLGHNPLGGWMIVLLLANVALVGLSGWLYTTDRFWGVKWVEELHEGLSHSLLILVVLHVSGVIFTSWRQRENLVAAMLHGRKRPNESIRAE